MTTKEKESEVGRFLCFSCLEESSDPHMCTNCGAPIEDITLENSFFLPPQEINYSIHFSDTSENEILAAVKFIEDNFHQSFDITKTTDGISIKSSDIAQMKLFQQLEQSTGKKLISRTD